jgi:hypothetical protein
VLPASAAEHYRQQQARAVATADQVAALWRTVGDDFDLGWSRIGGSVFAAVVAGQTAAAAEGLAYVPTVLDEQGIDGTAVATIDPNRFAGGTSDGRPVEYLLGAAPIKAKQAMATVPDVQAALVAAGDWLTTITLDAVRDANRDATAAQMGVTPDAQGWVRMLNPPSCRRCLILAGKFFRWNQGFLRHPRCDCRHIPSRESLAGDLTVDPYAYFHGLDTAGQDRLFGKADAQAIRDGADVYRVANVRMRGLSKATGRSGWQARRYGRRRSSRSTTSTPHPAATATRRSASCGRTASCSTTGRSPAAASSATCRTISPRAGWVAAAPGRARRSRTAARSARGSGTRSSPRLRPPRSVACTPPS